MRVKNLSSSLESISLVQNIRTVQFIACFASVSPAFTASLPAGSAGSGAWATPVSLSSMYQYLGYGLGDDSPRCVDVVVPASAYPALGQSLDTTLIGVTGADITNLFMIISGDTVEVKSGIPGAFELSFFGQ